MVGVPGFEPGITRSKPVALPLGDTPIECLLKHILDKGQYKKIQPFASNNTIILYSFT